MATVNEENERNVLVFVGSDVKVMCTYTSMRASYKINSRRDVIDQFLKSYLGNGLTETKMALNLDRGGIPLSVR
jgi:hypothetical protein